MNLCKTNAKRFSLLLGTMLITASLFAGSPVGDVVGKVTVGYQGWFSCSNDVSPRSTRWVHWNISNAPPRPGNTHFDLYPDVREYATTYATGFANLGNGSPARLFSSYDDQVVNKHVEWMQTYKIDTIALQRFGHSLTDASQKAWKDGMAVKIRNAAQTYGRKFYMMYDISGWVNFQTEIKNDWTNTITGALGLTNSSAYAKQNGKPVVCIWGIGSDIGNDASWTDVINFFKGKNCYVIIGVPRLWRTTESSSAYQYANMISPWTVGAFKTDAEIDNHATRLKDDKALCDSRGQDYQPIVWPGFSWANWKINEDGSIPAKNAIPRRHGDFMWRQFYQVRNQNIPSVYVAMFDEYDEGTAIAKAAENASMAPPATNQWFLTLNADGVACSSDFYLRLTRDGGIMVKSNAPMVTAHPTSHTLSCRIDIPAGNLTKNAGETLYVKVNTSDPDGVERVKIFMNETEGASDVMAPYEFNLPLNTAGTFVITAKVKDMGGTHTLSDNSITVTVKEINLPPYFIANPFVKPDATNGLAYSHSISGQAVDPEGGIKTFSKVAGPEWLTVMEDGIVQGTPGSADTGTNSFLVKVTDEGSLSATATMTIQVKRAVTIPVVSFIAPTDLTVQAGSSLYVNVGASDPDGISRVRLYKDGVELDHSEGYAPYEWNEMDSGLQNLQAGSFVLTAKATDYAGHIGETSITVQVVPGIPSVGSIITLKAVNGKYVTGNYSTNNTLIANKTTVSNYERFKVIDVTNSIALQCMGNNLFVSTDRADGSKPMVANRSRIGSLEQFRWVQTGSQIAIRSVRNTNYVSAVSNGVAPLQANRLAAGSYEMFSWKVE